MREYESIFVLDPSVSDSQVDMELEKIREFLAGKNCKITEVQKWGRRKLAYEIKKNKEGIYTLIRFNAEGEVPAELNRRYRLNESLLRYLTVLYEKPPAEETPPGEERGESKAGAQEVKAESSSGPKEDSTRPAAESKEESPGVEEPEAGEETAEAETDAEKPKE